MGLFGKIFDKKVCSVCGGDIGLLGNRKLEDGNLCKECAGKLSPFFSERRHSTVEEIKAQLRYREQNQGRAASFSASRSYGDCAKKLWIDDGMKAFAVTAASNFASANPDIIDFSAVTGCTPNIRESKTEVTHPGPDGKQVSFNPRRYDYHYDFYVTVLVNNPYFDDIEIKLNDRSADGTDRDNCNYYISMTEDVVEIMQGSRPDLSGRVPMHLPFCRTCGSELLPGRRCPVCNAARTAGQPGQPVARPTAAQPAANPQTPPVKPVPQASAKPQPAAVKPDMQGENKDKSRQM